MRMTTNHKNLLVWGLVVLVLLPFLLYGALQVAPGWHGFIVQSGSMEPAIPVGGVVFVAPAAPADIQRGDVITFNDPDKTAADTQRTTHRVVNVSRADGEYIFRTKGDANEEPDPGTVTDAQMVGRVILALPLMGYVLAWLSSLPGFILFVLAPAALLIGNELWTIWEEAC